MPGQGIRRWFLTDRIAALYNDLTREEVFFEAGAIIGLLLSATGLFALSAFAVQRRMKEIAVRKAMGATPRDLAMLLFLHFVGPILLAGAIALPLTAVLMDYWLRGFGWRIPMGLNPFLAALAIGLGAATLAIAFNTARAIRVHPAVILRQE